MQRTRSAASIVPLLPALAAGAVGVALTWRRWIDPLADSGREFDLPARVAAGQRLLHEIPHYYYGPLWPWLGGIFVRLFGPRFSTLEVPAGAAAAAIVAGLYFAVRRCAGPLAASIAATLAATIALPAFTPAALMFPYAVSNTLALAAGFTSLATIGRPRGAVVAAAGLAAMMLARPEVGLAMAGAVAIAGLRAGDRALGRRFTVTALAGTASAAAVYAVEYRGIALDDLTKRSALMVLQPSPTFRRFFLDNAGLLDPYRTSRTVIGDLAIVALALAGLAALSSPGFLPRLSRRARLFAVAGATAAGLAYRIATLQRDHTYESSMIFVAAPLLCALAAAWFLTRGPLPEDHLIPFLLCSFAAVASARVFFQLRLAWINAYSSFAFPPIAAAAAVLVLGRWRRPFIDRILFGRSIAIVAAGIITAHLSLLAHYRRYCAGRFIATPAGSIWLSDTRAAAFEQLISEVAVRANPGDGLIAFPESGFFNFVTRLPNPLGEGMVMPGSLRADTEAALASQLETDGPRFVVLANRPTPEFDKIFFGVDYARMILAAIGRRYRLARACGPAAPDAPVGSPDFFLRLYERADPNLPAGKAR